MNGDAVVEDRAATIPKLNHIHTGLNVAMKLLGVETQEAHDADIDRIEQVLDQQTILLQCLLWEVPAERCDGAQR